MIVLDNIYSPSPMSVDDPRETMRLIILDGNNQDFHRKRFELVKQHSAELSHLITYVTHMEGTNDQMDIIMLYFHYHRHTDAYTYLQSKVDDIVRHNNRVLKINGNDKNLVI